MKMTTQPKLVEFSFIAYVSACVIECRSIGSCSSSGLCAGLMITGLHFQRVKGPGIRTHTGAGDTAWQPILNLYNPLWPNHAILRQRSGSILADPLPEPMLTPHWYCKMTFILVNFTRYISVINYWNSRVNYVYKISFKFPSNQFSVGGKLGNLTIILTQK